MDVADLVKRYSCSILELKSIFEEHEDLDFVAGEETIKRRFASETRLF